MVERLSKAHSMQGWALAGISLVVAQGDFFGLVGPHGAGKSTLVRILATIIRPDGGRASIGGYDVATAYQRIRPMIGYVSQALGLDERLTGRENVRMMARLYGLSRQDADRRTEQMLAQLELTAVGDCRVAHYPTGARKRLALARALVHRPFLLLVDDPTAGVPPHDQAAIWHSLRSANQAEDITVFLTTQRVEEADSMCQRVAIIDGGKLLAAGTPAELKAQVTGATVAIRLAFNGRLPGAAMVLERVQGVRDLRLHADRLELEVASATTMPLLLRLLEEHEIPVRDIALSKPSLEEVFFRHTGRKMHEDTSRRPWAPVCPEGADAHERGHRDIIPAISVAEHPESVPVTRSGRGAAGAALALRSAVRWAAGHDVDLSNGQLSAVPGARRRGDRGIAGSRPVWPGAVC